MSQELRLYSFVTFYLAKGIHAGIQTGHAAVDLVQKYRCLSGEPSEQTKMVEDWADNHKTFIVLNGGMHVEMQRVLELTEKSGFPFAVFHESQEALNGIMTSIVVVLPEDIFNLRREQDAGGVRYTKLNVEDGMIKQITYTPNDELFPFIDMLKSKRMAD